ncbi:LacI family DNA-binding transcriptional regulator [Lacrimispora sp.]|uniref:LacI family DNA-binding transcriptional regulator n=1 Tax=Lacrimispora sp. TaxID=2719234 RepID=UPI00285B34C3|nr:substrate-binding domain-containing protein [Lacrimispora sp.]MDR7811976.1 substrate-binding domain-containing protein [Lacrimispora sp.]
MSIGIKEVAKEAGVSIATVSRALNNEGYVSESAYKKVVEAAKRLNYEPNYLAQSLLKQKTNIIGVVVSDIGTSFFSKILKSIENCASEKGYSIMICNIEEDLEKEKKYLSVFKRMCVDGIILTNEQTDEELLGQLAAMSDIPMIACSCHIHGVSCASVNIDDYKAAYDAVSYLHRLGHRKIAYIGAELHDFTVGRQRYEGVRDSLADKGFPMKEQYVWLSGLKIEHGYKMMKNLLKTCKDDLPTAIFAGSDDVAVGIINCAFDFGYRVPEDFSILGFDNSEISASMRPAISTVHQPIEEIGYFSVSTLIDLIEREERQYSNLILPHKIIERDSCIKIFP